MITRVAAGADQIALSGDHGAHFGGIHRDGFLGQDVLAVFKRFEGEGSAGDGRKGEDHGVDRRIFEKLRGVGGPTFDAELFGGLFREFRAQIADCCGASVGEFSDAAHVVLRDDSASDDGNV